MKTILPCIVTAHNACWIDRIDEAENYKISSLALFLTGLEKKERQLCYRKLERIKDLQIPFVHLRSDMESAELEYLSNRYKTKKFNCHPQLYFPLEYNLDSFKNSIYVENSGNLIESDLTGFAGICLDLAHLEESRLFGYPRYKTTLDLLKKYPVGVNHLSALEDTPFTDESGSLSYSSHTMKDYRCFDYLKRLSINYFGEYLALEIVNPIPKQLLLIEYLHKALPFTS